MCFPLSSNSLSLGLLILLHSRVCGVRLLDTCNKPCGECAVLYCSLLYMGIVQMTIVTHKLINKATRWCSWAREQKTWRKCCNEQLVLSVYANQEPLEKNIWCDAEKSLWEKGQQEERRRRRQEKNREKERQSRGDERQDEEEQKERGTVLGGLTCGNPVFMDVYLSASPKGSSYFPFGNSWSLDKKSLTESGKAGGQISDGVSPSWDKDTNFLIRICFCAILLNINPSFFQVWIQYIVHCHLHSMAGFADMTGCHLFKGPINVWSEAYHCVYTMCLQLKTLSLL